MISEIQLRIALVGTPWSILHHDNLALREKIDFID